MLFILINLTLCYLITPSLGLTPANDILPRDDIPLFLKWSDIVQVIGGYNFSLQVCMTLLFLTPVTM